MLFYDQLNTALALQAWDYTGGGGTTPAPSVAVDSQRNTTLSALPAGASATDYEYQFRPAPTIGATRQADFSQTLAPGESPTDYEYQVR